MSINTYEQNRILSASPLELVQILYTAAVRAVDNAQNSLEAGDIASRSREINKTQEILFELAASVDSSKGKEIGDRLLVLYDYMQGRLAEANMKQQTEPLAEVSNLLRILQGAWSQCAAANELEPALR